MKHPARFTPIILDALLYIAEKYEVEAVFDPFAGTGQIHELRRMSNGRIVTLGSEVEEEWANMNTYTLHMDAETFLLSTYRFTANGRAAVMTSPTYGNRFADHHKAKDGSMRRSYRHDLGHDLSPLNSGALQWGAEYKDFHLEIWRLAYRFLLPNDLLVIDIKDHVRKGKLQGVPEWHFDTCERLGFTVVEVFEIPVSGMRYGKNRARAENQYIMVFER